MAEPEAYEHLRREHHVYVAAGMDILVALGMHGLELINRRGMWR